MSAKGVPPRLLAEWGRDVVLNYYAEVICGRKRSPPLPHKEDGGDASVAGTRGGIAKVRVIRGLGSMVRWPDTSSKEADRIIRIADPGSHGRGRDDFGLQG
jgi:hypothetical protein